MKEKKLKNNANKKSSAKESKPLIEDAYRKIKMLIFQRKLVPGQRLVYDDLGKLLQMSRTPIINALNRLEQQGLVISESYRGFCVKPMDIQEAWEAFGLREALETYAVAEAIKTGDAQGMQELEEKLLAYENYKPNYYDQNKILLDARFHLQIAWMTRNRILRWHLKINLEHVYLRANLDSYNVARVTEATKEHHRLLNHMKRKDILGSVEIIRNHIINARDNVIACLSKQDLAMKQNL